MKVILLQDIETLGIRGDVKTVKPGYARNYLLPRGMAMLAHTGNMKVANHMEAARTRREQKKKDEIQKMLEGAKDVVLEFKARASEDGKLFGSITAKDIVAQLEKVGYHGVEEKWVELPEHVKRIGEHTVTVSMGQGATVPLRVNVVREA
ncbi:MAG: 50S ribosomal protein L9 [Candidatus Kerfeldbacteria bacterium]|nr:50S ribosomal protein L9 [Candidatus Kerfeldbacteria bacterium]